MPESTLMGSSQARLEQKGFQPYYFMLSSGRPAVVLSTSRLLPRPSGETDIALLLMHPAESLCRIYNDDTAMQALVDRFLASCGGDIPADRLRLFVVEEGRHVYDASHLLEIPLFADWRLQLATRRSPSWWPWRRSMQPYRFTVTLSHPDDWLWNSLDSELGAAVLTAFELTTLQGTLKRYMAVLEGAYEPQPEAKQYMSAIPTTLPV